MDARLELSKLAGISDNTMAKDKTIFEKAPEPPRIWWSGQEEFIHLLFALPGLTAGLPLVFAHISRREPFPTEGLCRTYIVAGFILICEGVIAIIFFRRNSCKFEDKVALKWSRLKSLQSCANLKLDQVWVCNACGLEINIAKECACSRDQLKTCESNLCLSCFGQPMELKC
jgi:hypothetical protein